MARFFDGEEWADTSEDRRAVVAHELARIGLDLDDPSTVLAGAPVMEVPRRDFNTALAERDGFVRLDNGRSISPTLERMLRMDFDEATRNG